MRHLAVLFLILGFSATMMAEVATTTPPDPDKDKIKVDKSGSLGNALVGDVGAVEPGATVRVVDGNGGIRESVAEEDGSFSFGLGALNVQSCTYVLVSQIVGGMQSNAVPIHSDPPFVDFGFATWEDVFARYLIVTKASEHFRDGEAVLVRPRGEQIVYDAASGLLHGGAGATNSGSLVTVTDGCGRVWEAISDDAGAFRLGVGKGAATLIVSQTYGQTHSRSTPVRS